MLRWLFDFSALIPKMHNPYLDISDEVAQALANNLPVVALESTIISHGMPYPNNVHTALKVEKTVRAGGAVPATIAILNGRLTVGLSPAQIEMLGHTGPKALKVSRRDMAMVVAGKQPGATTVASTMMIAAMAGIRVFATGGIGGVHRGAEHTFDISADLQELAHTPVAVVCAGAKSILDLGLTLEYLETHGVPVLGYQTNELPAFYTRESGHALNHRVDTPQAAAHAMAAQWGMGLAGGVVVANPIPTAFEMPKAAIDKAIASALAQAAAQGISGKETTPFLLAKVAELTGGNSLEANIGLVLNNANLGASIATSYANLVKVPASQAY